MCTIMVNKCAFRSINVRALRSVVENIGGDVQRNVFFIVTRETRIDRGTKRARAEIQHRRTWRCTRGNRSELEENRVPVDGERTLVARRQVGTPLNRRRSIGARTVDADAPGNVSWCTTTVLRGRHRIPSTLRLPSSRVARHCRSVRHTGRPMFTVSARSAPGRRRPDVPFSVRTCQLVPV